MYKMGTADEEMLGKVLRLASESLKIPLPSSAVVVVRVDDGYEYLLVDVFNHGRTFILNTWGKVETLREARTAMKAWGGTPLHQRLAFLHESLGRDRKQWTLLDLDTLEKRVAAGRSLALSYGVPAGAVASA